ncbi:MULTISPECIES: hypothetical protein [Mangrovimonas]|uniref:hypothetical protein n=1 Tax=Mangrovimonas TaxID=1211036 RepID=UPI0012F992AC|nr:MULTISPECIES: hypothetical protein [Mangrovimonas]MCF1422371.1 hypothetical protein [Mangrovimonas futianensis]NIK92884.1 hypothetical protein [Mangrovimonas sp. CR14]
MKRLIIFIFFLMTVAYTQAQKMDWEKIKTLKVAFLTEKLNLSKAEAEKFWPIYNDFEEKFNTLRKKMSDSRNFEGIETLSESESKKRLREIIALEKEKHDALETYVNDLQSVLSANKILLLKKAEDEFRHKMFNEFKKRRHQGQN